MMIVRDKAREYQKRLRDVGVPIAAVLREAGVDRSTWTYWKGGVRPRIDTWNIVEMHVLAALADPAKYGGKAPANGEAA